MQDTRKEQLLEFCKSLGIKMHRLELLDTALTHTSYAHEAKKNPRPEHNERVEFLGDSVLSIIVSTYMYCNFPNLNEGELTKLRAHIVCEVSLAEYARKINLGKYLLLGKGEDLTGGRERASILADAFESVLGAYYIDQGMDAARVFLLGLMKTELNFICTHGICSDFKTRLQEVAQQKGDVDIVYELTGSKGPEHNKHFATIVSINGKQKGAGEGKTKKEAEQQAAKNALEKMGAPLTGFPK